MEYTTNYDLRKPGVNDVYNVADNNENMDTIDAALASKAENRIVNSTTPGLMTSTDFLKLAGIATGAEKNVQADWTETSTTSDAYIKNKPSTFPPSSHSHSQSDITGLTNALAGKASTAVATTSSNGLMSSSDKTKLNGIAAGAEVNVQSDWNVTSTTSDAYIKNKPSTFPPSSHSHAQSDITGLANALASKASTAVATTSSNGLMSSSDKSKLNGIATGAEVNVQSDWNVTSTTSDAYIKNKPSSFPPSTHSHDRLENGANGLYVTNSGNIIPIKNGGVEASFNPQLGNNTSRFGQIYSTNATISTSDAREKKDIADIEHAQELIMALQPRQFKYVDNQSNRTHYGFIAQEVKEAMTAAGIDDCAAYIRGPLDETADPNTAPEEEVRYGLRYEELIAPLIATVQAQQKEIEFLKTKINE